LGKHPRQVVTTTPKPIKLLRELIANPDTVVTRGSTYDNRENLAPAFFSQIVRKYEGTRLGRQELLAEILDDVPGALWTRDMIEATRLPPHSPIDFKRIVVAIDPAVSAGENADETGIVVAGQGWDGHAYVLEDLSGRYSPTEWATKAISGFRRWRADRIVAETNQGGDLIEATLRVVDPSAPLRRVHAKRGKLIRAEPVSALYEQRRAHHIGGFSELEDQLCSFAPGASDSPDRLDALVYALTELMVEAPRPRLLFA
jgi:phage terminase large subunit-like protein